MRRTKIRVGNQADLGGKVDTGAGLRLELGARQVQGLGGDRHFPGAQGTLILSSSFLPSFFASFLSPFIHFVNF